MLIQKICRKPFVVVFPPTLQEQKWRERQCKGPCAAARLRLSVLSSHLSSRILYLHPNQSCKKIPNSVNPYT